MPDKPKMKQLFSIIITLLIPFVGHTQTTQIEDTLNSPYKLSLKTDLSISLTGLTFFGMSVIVAPSIDPLTTDEVAQLDRNDIWVVDRGATYNYNETAGTVSDVFLYTSVFMPSLLAIDKKMRHDFGRISIMYLESMILTLGINSFTKEVTQRIRPFAYNPDVDDELKVDHLNVKRSFFSGHTSTTATVSFFMATVFAEYHPNSRAKPAMWTFAAAMPFAVAILRVLAGKHYPTDVAVGYAIGAASGILVPYFHKVHKKKKDNNEGLVRL